jgi:hypothetical protein
MIWKKSNTKNKKRMKKKNTKNIMLEEKTPYMNRWKKTPKHMGK